MRDTQRSWVSWAGVGSIAAGILCIIGGDRLPSPTLLQVGLGLIGFGLIASGGEAMVTRRFVLQRWGFGNPAYRGLGAVFNGIVFVWIGLALIAVALVLFTGEEQALVRATIRRPGFALLNLSFLALAASGTELANAIDARRGSAAGWFLRALSALPQSIPGLVLLLLALALLALGLLEIVSPATFDALGGGFLEVLFLEGAS